jgi:hypothetical protein
MLAQVRVRWGSASATVQIDALFTVLFTQKVDKFELLKNPHTSIVQA